jgi:uncharacterized protein (DUF1778 family)
MSMKLAEDELALIRAAAAAQGKPMAEWVRGTALSASASYFGSTGGAAIPNP